MKKNIACPNCKGNGYITITTGNRNDYCGVANKTCPACYGTGVQLADMTNADRIRAMSDEELAHELALVAGWDRKQYEKAKFIGIEKVMHDWLQQPAQEEL